MKNKKKHLKRIIVLFILSFLTLFFYHQYPAQTSVPKELLAVLKPQAKTLQPFTLTDDLNHKFTINNLSNKWSFIFFGYTHCPDICPTTLFTLKQIFKSLKNYPHASSEIQVIFVSVDPERDNSTNLTKYIKYFNKEFIAVTGTNENLASFSRQFSAGYLKEKSDSPGQYLMSHTSSIFLVNPKMQIVASFSPPHDKDTITSQFLKIQHMF